MSTYTVLESGTYLSLDRSASFFWTAGTVIPLDQAVRFGMPNAVAQRDAALRDRDLGQIIRRTDLEAYASSARMQKPHFPIMTNVRAWYSTVTHGLGRGSSSTTTVLALVADRVYAVPIYLEKSCHITGMMVQVTTAGAAGTIARMAIATINGRTTAGTYDAAIVYDPQTTVAVDTVGIKKFAGVDYRVPESGWYVLLLWSSGAPAVRSMIAANGIFAEEENDVADIIDVISYMYGPRAGAATNVFPASVVMTVVTVGSGPVLAVLATPG